MRGVALIATTLILLAASMAPSAATHASNAGSRIGPGAVSPVAQAANGRVFVQFWGRVNNSVRANCYIVGGKDATARCDRYYDKDGVIHQGASLYIEHGRASRREATDATGDRTGRRIRNGHAISASRFRCRTRATSFLCRDKRTKHGFAINGHGYRLF